jgi:hypothetical protein
MLAGTEDHFIPFHQTADFEKALVNARSVTTRIFDRPSGGAGHCQCGNLTFAQLFSIGSSPSFPSRRSSFLRNHDPL